MTPRPDRESLTEEDIKLFEEIGYPHAVAEHIRAQAAEIERLKASCPCTRTTPCSTNCTCANGVLSGGCSRCCRYGSEDQRDGMAKTIAKRDAERAALKEEVAAWRGQPPEEDDGESGPPIVIVAEYRGEDLKRLEAARARVDALNINLEEAAGGVGT